MKTKNDVTHTPGPWTWGDGKVRSDEVLPLRNPAFLYRENAIIAEVTLRDDNSHQANARLIATAPELLNALKRLEQAITHPDKAEQFAAVEAARAAIAKAEGK